MFGAGEQYKYGLAVDKKYGDGTAKKLAKLARSEFKVTRAYLEQVIKEAKDEIALYEENRP